MFSSRILDKTSNCNIIKHSLLDDLLPYKYTANNTLVYSDGTTSAITSKKTILTSLASSSQNSSYKDTWQPLFISDDANVDNKLLSEYGSVHSSNSSLRSNQLGIENFYNFTPKFRSWTTSAKMSVDWLINAPDTSYAIYYGIACWFRLKDSNNPNTHNGVAQPLSYFPNGSRLINNNILYIKLNDSQLYKVDSQSKILTNGTWTFNNELNNSIIDSATLGASALFQLSTKYSEENRFFNTQPINTYESTMDPIFWIPDGDCFFFFNSEEEKEHSLSKSIPSRSYISSSLYRKYSSIYRILTLDEKRTFNNKELKKSRIFKRIAHALSTSPFIDDFAIKALDSKVIKDLINSHMLNMGNNISSEISIFKTLLLNISRYLQNTSKDLTNKSIYLDTKFTSSTLNNNLIVNDSQLFYKLISKYGAKLLISSNTSLQANTSVLKFNNKGIAVTQVLDSYCGKNVVNTALYNNQKITFDNSVIETKINENNANIEVKTGNNLATIIPLYDVGKPMFGNSVKGFATTFCPALSYKGDIPGNQRNDGVYYDESAETTTYIYQTVVDGGAEVNLPNQSLYPHCSKLFTEGLQLQSLVIDDMHLERSYNELSLLNVYEYINDQNSFLWEQLEGPEGVFDKDNEISSLSGRSAYPKFYANYTGKYVFQCTINSPFGNFKKQRTVYIVDGRELLMDNFGQYTIPNGISLKKYYDPNTKTWVSPPVLQLVTIAPSSNAHIYKEFIPLILDKDNNTSTVCKINKLAINNSTGIFYPIKTNFCVREYIGNPGLVATDKVYKLEKDYVFRYINDFTNKDNTSFSIVFTPNNTIIKIHSIWLEKIRSDDESCSQCLSLQKPTLRSYKSTVSISDNITTTRYEFNKTVRTNKFPEFFSLRSYVWDSTRNKAKFDKEINYDCPIISTTKAPSIKSYGGYSRKFLDDINISVTGLAKPSVALSDKNLISSNPIALPKITGYKLDYRNDSDPSTFKLCYQKAISVNGAGLIMPFAKGVFHPNSGWIPHFGGTPYTKHSNRCGVLKFNPGARDTFSFIGPQITRISSGQTLIDDNIIKPKLFSSSISLSIAPSIQWDPFCGCKAPESGVLDQLYDKNQVSKEHADILIYNSPNLGYRSNHGYRILAGGQPKLAEVQSNNNYPIANDEFLTDQTATNFSYGFAVTGPSSLPNDVRKNGRINLRNPRVNAFGVKDIEVKINFLNYVDTKNLVIWLEADYCGADNAARFPQVRSGPPPSPLKTSTEFLDQSINPRTFFGEYSTNQSQINGFSNIELQNYLIDYLSMNSASGISNGKIKLILLNQENIQNNGYNFSIKFSDHASKNNVSCDLNLLPTGYDLNIIPTGQAQNESINYHSINSNIIHQNIVKINEELLPSIMATGYSDRESCSYVNTIKQNKLNISNNTFSKFVSDLLFKNKGPESGRCLEGSPEQQDGDFGGITKFTLNIMVLDEEEDMNINDTSVGSQYLSGLESTENKSKSHILYNSLCNWELILHVGNVRDPVPHTNPSLASYGNSDILSLIEYKKEPSYPGNSFIADLTKYKHLLPLANYNAPYCAIADSATCLTSQDDPTGQGVLLQPPEFPTYAIIMIIAGLSAYAATTGGSLVGALAGLGAAVNSPGYNAIFNYFTELRWKSNLEDQGRQIYSPSYAKYPYGSPEKILINFKKPDSLWYTTEATIFKYHNTPILKPNRYNFIRLSKHTAMGEFKFDTLSNNYDLIGDEFTKQISLSCDTSVPTTTNTPTEVSGVWVNHGDIVNLSFVPGSGQKPCDEKNKTTGGLYVVQSGASAQWIKLNPSGDLSGLCKANYYLQHNSVLSVNNNIGDSATFTNIKKTILLNNRISYDIFKKDDILDCIGPSATGTAKIVKKGLIFKNNSYYSVIVCDQDMSTYDTIFPSSGINLFFVYKNQTTIQDNTQVPYNVWGLDSVNKNVINNYVDIAPTTHSVGSYGDMSLFVNKNMLSNNISNNKLQNIYEIFNNSVNDKIKHNNVNIFKKETTMPVAGQDLTLVAPTTKLTNSYGFSYSKLDFDNKDNYIIEKKNKNVYFNNDKDEDFTNILNNNRLSSANKDGPHHFSIVRTEYEGDYCIPTGVLQGELEVEHDYYNHKPIRSITSDELFKLTTRLNTIRDNKVNDTLSALVGDEVQTTQLLNSSNLKYIMDHFNKLPEDPPDCDMLSPANATLCYKKKTMQKIKDLYKESNEILELLDHQTVKSVAISYGNTSITGDLLYETSTSYFVKAATIVEISKKDVTSIRFIYILRSSLNDNDSRKTIHTSILPKIEPVISGSNPISISYKNINTDHYWINIDPKQCCFLDFESNPKVLISTQYACVTANPGFNNDEPNNNICPEFITKSVHAPNVNFGGENLTVSSKEIDGKQFNAYKYTINSSKIDQQKSEFQSQFPAITGWTKVTRNRYFNINGDETMDIKIAVGSEITVNSEEQYYVPLVADVGGTDNLSADAVSVEAIGACQTNYGSPGGKGLMSIDPNTRIGISSRVENIVNLTDATDISIKVKKIPRLLRGIDLLATIYRYGNRADFRSTNNNPKIPLDVDLVGVEGYINNSMYVWHCLQRNPETKNLEPGLLPDFLKVQNEMIFRSFFGSVDKIENKLDVAASYFPWELIPYEFE